MNASRTALDALEHFLDDVGAHGGVLEVEADQGLTASLIPNDPVYQCCQKGHYEAINLPAAYCAKYGKTLCGSSDSARCQNSGCHYNSIYQWTNEPCEPEDAGYECTAA